jgi:hypothetical protein
MCGNLTEKEIRNCKTTTEHKNIKNFVETGTYKADSTILAAKQFENIFTIEIVENLFKEAVIKAGGKLPNIPLLKGTSVQVKNINFSLGDSTQILNTITHQVSDGAVFFIDAHQSGADTGNNGKWVPLFEELNIILSHKIGPSVFIFNDLRLFDKHWDWKGINCNKIIEVFQKHKYPILKSYTQNDRFYVLTK